MKKELCLFASLAMLIGTAPAIARAESDQIVFRVRTIAVVCTGVCPHFELTIGRDGVVTERFLGITGEGTDKETNEGTRKLKTFRLSKSRTAAFFALLAPLRPKGHRRFGKPCDADVAADEVTHGFSEFELRWQGGGPRGYLEACFRDRPVNAALERAFDAIGVEFFSGERVRSKSRR